MTITLFLQLFVSFSVISGLFTEAIKKLIEDKANFSMNVIALIVAMIVSCIGTFLYYQLASVPFTINNIIYAFLMGISSGVGSMVGYDKVKQTIEQILNK